jgi:hypothetical protein
MPPAHFPMLTRHCPWPVPLAALSRRLLAAVPGQAWNASQRCCSLGLRCHTVTGTVDLLAEAALIRRLGPCHANTRKRLSQSPYSLA